MKTTLRAFRVLLILTLVTGVLYPLVVTALAQLLTPVQANGSLLCDGPRIVGSALLAQKFASPRYFESRPSAADFATIPSGASNFGPTSGALRSAVEERRAKWGAEAPADLLTASGSGLDPHLSPAGALFQVERVAQARGRAASELRQLVEATIEPPQFGFLGEPRINILALNRALDRLP